MKEFELRDITFAYGEEKPIFQNLSLGIEEGKILGIIGPNGVGKTTLLRILSGALAPSQGEVFYRGKPLKNMEYRNIAQHIAFVSQRENLAFSYRVIDYVLLGRTPHLGRFYLEGKEDYRIAQKALELTDCLPFQERIMENLSGGEWQRVRIARALAQEPRTLLLDEPSVFLDMKHQMEIFNLLKSLNKRGITIVVVNHDLNFASEYCEKLILLRDGKVFAQGEPEEVITERSLWETFGLQVRVMRNPLTGKPHVLLKETE